MSNAPDSAVAAEAAVVHHGDHTHRRPRWALGPWALLIPLFAAILLRNRVDFLQNEEFRLWSTLFVSVVIQALPFLVLGVVISGAIAAYVSPDLVRRLVPRRTALAIPSAGLAGLALPGCECGSVPIAGRLVGAGMPSAAALTFLLAAPAINPVVLVATAVAFPGNGQLVFARFAASLLTAIVVGSWWARRGGESLLDSLRSEEWSSHNRWSRLVDVASRDLVHAGGYLVVGAMAAATLQLVVPRSIISTVAESELLSVLMFAALAVVLSICSEADAFVAVGLPQFSLTSRLVFLVVGPVIDLKLVAMHIGVFGRRFALRFAPVTLVVAIISAVVIGQVLL
ncbi:MAG: permease [Acidimicrobiia bacterium]|nr:permease [Acidimicrobiia bacterium]